MGRPPQAEAAIRRERIIDAAHRLFLDHGYDGTSLEAVARESGTAKKTVYRHFHDKNGLFAAVIERLTDEWLDNLRDLIGPDVPPRTALRAVALRMVEANARPSAVAVQRLVFAEAPRFPELARAYHDNGAARGLRPLAEYLANQNARGALRLADPDAAAEQFAFLVTGALRRRALLGLPDLDERVKQASYVDQAVCLFLEGCVVRQNGNI